MLAAYVTVGPVSWTLKAGTHTMPSRSNDGHPSFIFSMARGTGRRGLWLC